MNIIIANLIPEKIHIRDKLLERRVTTLHFPTGLGIIAACLKNAGRRFETYDSYVNGSTEDFLKTIEAMRPDCVLLSGFLGNFGYTFVKEIVYKIKTIHQPTLIVLGGPMASVIPELLLSKAPLDFIVKGEGENTIIELLEAIEKKYDFATVKGIYLKMYQVMLFLRESEQE